MINRMKMMKRMKRTKRNSKTTVLLTAWELQCLPYLTMIKNKHKLSSTPRILRSSFRWSRQQITNLVSLKSQLNGVALANKSKTIWTRLLMSFRPNSILFMLIATSARTFRINSRSPICQPSLFSKDQALQKHDIRELRSKKYASFSKVIKTLRESDMNTLILS